MAEPLINIAVKAALAAGKIIARAVTRLDIIKISQKQPNDFVTDIDQQAEREIIGIIQKAHPDHSILAEESGETQGNDYQWVIDPLDGTRNFIHGFPHFAVSIAINYRGRTEHGVIYDPIRDELFVATRGKGAKLNDRKIRISERKQLSDALLGTGFPFRHEKQNQEAYSKILQTILPICGDIRRAGAATLDLAYVAAGRLDGFWEMGLCPWDTAAGVLLIKEAGGMVVDFNGGEGYTTTGDIVAGNPAMIKLLLKTIRPNLLELNK